MEDARCTCVSTRPTNGRSTIASHSLEGWIAQTVTMNVAQSTEDDAQRLCERQYAPDFAITFGNTTSSQRAAVTVWIGEIEPQGSVPGRLPGFFRVGVSVSDGTDERSEHERPNPDRPEDTYGIRVRWHTVELPSAARDAYAS